MNTPIAIAGKGCLCASVLFATLLSINTVQADEIPGRSPSLYYQMGGGESVIAEALNASGLGKMSIVEPLLRMPTACEIWANKENISDYMFALIDDYFDTLMNNVVNNLVVAVKNVAEQFVVSQLQKALPGTYDWMTNSLAQLNVKSANERASCEAAVAAGSGGAIEDWMKDAKSRYWQATLTSDYDATTTDTTLFDVAGSVDVEANNTPLPWFGGEVVGGVAGKPIKVVKDVVSAGYAAMSSKIYEGARVTAPPTSPTTRVEGTGTKSNRLATMWASTDEAILFANRVLGEESVEYCDGCESSFTPGLGLKPIMSEEMDKLAQKWADLIAMYPPGRIDAYPTGGELKAISSPSTQIHLQLYLGLMKRPELERNVFIDRLISDIALELTFEKGIALRQMLRAGMMTPEVQSYEAAKERTKRLIDTAREEIEELTSDATLRQQLAANTAATLMSGFVGLDLQEASGSVGVGSSVVSNVIRDGAPVQLP